MYNNGSETMRILGEQRRFDYITPEVMQDFRKSLKPILPGEVTKSRCCFRMCLSGAT